MSKKNIATKALLDMDNIVSAIKEESKNSLNTLLGEAVKNALREGCSEENDDNDNDEYEVTDDENIESSENSENNDSEEDGKTEEEPIGPEEPDELADGGEDIEDGNDDFEPYSNYKVGDETYDLTGENDYDTVVKVYKLLNDTDQVVVKQDGDKIQLRDNENDTEYVIDLGGNEEDNQDVESEDFESLNEDSEFDSIAGFPDSEDEFEFEFEEPEYEDNLDFEFEEPEFEEPEDEELFENFKNFRNKPKQRNKLMKENKDVLFEIDLEYTDDYQDKDPIANLSNQETSKTGRSWHKGIPTGTDKPWAGDSKSKGTPFKQTKKVENSVNENDDMFDDEMDEATNIGGAVHNRSNSKNHVPNGRKQYLPKNSRHISTTTDGYEELVSEMKTIKNENKQLRQAVMELKKNLSEAYITNYNLGKITKLFVENTTSQAEKIDIVNRFANEGKTVEQSNSLYESINKDLKKVNKDINLNESSMTAKGTKQLNETKTYASNDLLRTKDLMNRIMNF